MTVKYDEAVVKIMFPWWSIHTGRMASGEAEGDGGLEIVLNSLMEPLFKRDYE